jgi:hypothetical protein
MPAESEYSNRELIDILRRGYESKDLDYKGPMLWDESDKKACCEVVKDILGMANTLGGFIVIGVSEAPTGFSWDGLNPEQSKTFDTTRLNRFVQNYADPPINARLRKIEHDGRCYVIVEVPRFPDTPHVCQKDYPDVLRSATLYVRTDNNDTAPLRSSADFRVVIERAVRNRSDTLLTALRSILTTGAIPQPAPVESSVEKFEAQQAEAVARFEELNPLKGSKCAGFLQASFFPEEFKNSRFTMEQLREAAMRGSVDFKGWPFLPIHVQRQDWTYALQDGLETFVQTKDIDGDDLVDFWRFQQSGFFYQRTAMRPNSLHVGSNPARCVVDFRAVAIYVAEAINCLTRIYDGLLSDEDRVLLSLAVVGTQDRLLVSSGPMAMALWGDYTCRIPEVFAKRTYPLADWRAGMIDHAIELAKDVYLRFNWLNPNLDAARGAIEKLFARRW